MRDGLLIIPHLGLGDAIILNGLVRVLAQSYKFITFPSKWHNAQSVSWMFSDLKNVRVASVNDDEAMTAMGLEWPDKEKLCLGMFGEGWMGDNRGNFDQQIYEQAGVNFECSWSHFKIPYRPFKLDPSVDVFLCDDMARGFRINRTWISPGRQIITPHITETIFYWEPYIRNAKEIHCIDSSFMCWIDRMPAVNGQRLYWHRYSRRHEDRRLHPTFHKPWAILD